MEQITVIAVCLCLVVVSLHLNTAKSGHIVGMANHYHSHQSTLRKLGEELGIRGHRYIQLVPHFLERNLENIDVKVFNTSLTSDEVNDIMIKLMRAGDLSSLTGIYKMSQIIEQAQTQSRQLCEDLFDNKIIMNELKENVDVFLCDITSLCCFILADMFNVTRVDVSSLGFGSSSYACFFGLPQSAVYLTQETVTDPADPLKFSFTRRLVSFLHYKATQTMFSYMLPKDLWLKYAKPTSQHTNVFNAWRLHNLALVGHDFALEYARPMGPHIKVIGAILPNPPKSLPDDLNNFMSRNKNIVLASFGTAISDFSPELVQVIADGLGKVSATVLWKLSASVSLNVAQNIKIVSWIPQNDVLGHTSTKVFVTHCGLNSVLESVYHGVPMIAIPLFGDQHRQATLVKLKGLGITLDKYIMKADDLTQAIHEVLQNKLFQNNAKHISAIMKDRKQTPAQEGADWVEYALRHDGAKHFISDALDLPEYQLYCYDVLLFLMLMFAATIFLFVKVCSFLCQKKNLSDANKIKRS